MKKIRNAEIVLANFCLFSTMISIESHSWIIAIATAILATQWFVPAFDSDKKVKNNG